MLRFFLLGSLLFFTICFQACGQKNIKNDTQSFNEMMQKKPTTTANKLQDTATFAAGCFWCVEAQFQQLAGVDTVISGFSGGHTPNPTYKEVCTGKTGYAEACNIIYDPTKITFDALLAAFFTAHDPTQLNRQGNDIGTQYRSVIFYHNKEQKDKAEYYIQKLNEEKAYPNPIVTEVSPYKEFFIADISMQNYYKQNPNAAYCQYVIKPEVEKFKKVFKGKLKK